MGLAREVPVSLDETLYLLNKLFSKSLCFLLSRLLPQVAKQIGLVVSAGEVSCKLLLVLIAVFAWHSPMFFVKGSQPIVPVCFCVFAFNDVSKLIEKLGVFLLPFEVVEVFFCKPVHGSSFRRE